jgi:3-hydroxyacyl-[acyl-carrier-protein] dehydratase
MLYTILTINKEAEDSAKVDVQLNPNHDIFKGHFPQQPVLPGACMVQMLRDILQKITDTKLEFHRGQNIKFISLVVPGGNNLLTFQIQTKINADGLLSVNSTLYSQEIASMKFSGTYKIKE